MNEGALNMQKTFTLTLTKEEDEEFRRFYNVTSQCSGVPLYEIGDFAGRTKMWTKEQLRKFITWFILEGLEEGWLIDEMGA